jgi:hypothetical protein
MDKVQKHNSFNTNTPSSESYRNYLKHSSANFVAYYVVIFNSVMKHVFITVECPFVNKNMNWSFALVIKSYTDYIF